MATFYKNSRFVVMLAGLLLAFTTVFAQQQTLENNQICMDPIAGRGAFINAVNTGLCVGCTAASGANIIDGNLTNFATLTTGISLLGSGSAVSVKDSLQYYPSGNTVGFVVGSGSTLLDVNLLNNIQIRTYRNGTLVETATFNSGAGLLKATAFGGTTGKQILSFTTTGDFDEVQLFAASGLLGLLSSLDVYYAFEGPASCPLDCVNALVGADASGVTTGSTTTGLGVCLGGGVSNPNNAIDADSTNAAQISLVAGINCARYLQVALANTVSPTPGDVYAGFVVQQGSGLLDVNVLGNITITTYLGSNTTPLQTISGGSLLTASLLGGTRVQLGFKVTQPFDKIRISGGGLLSVAYDLNVYYAFVKTDSDADGMLDCMDKCSGNDLLDTDGDGIPNFCDENMADLNVLKTVNNDSVAAGTDVTFTVTVNRQADATGFEAPTGLKIKDLLPVGLTYVSHTAPTGTFYNPTTGIWNVGSALSGATTSLVLSITASADSSGVLSNIAEVFSVNEGDPDSTPGNGTGGAGDDDIASACVSVPVFLCPGSSISLSAPSGSTSYQWYRNGTLIAGATDSTYVVTESGSYTFTSSSVGVCVSGNCCPVVVIYRTLVANAGADPAPVCEGTTVVLTGSGAGVGGTYLWSTGATTASISVTPTTTTTYYLTVTSVDGCVDTDTVVVTVNPKPLLGSVIALCNNAGTTDNPTDDTFTFTINPEGGSNTTYTVSGAVTAGPFNYGTPQVFGPFLASTGNKVITITDANTCSTTITVVAPVGGCSNCPPTPVCVPVTVKKLQ
jgi:uncharacterized repeat protein (TIGR01451 family)